MKKLFFISIVSLMFMGCISTSDIYGNKVGNFYVKDDEVRQTTTVKHKVFAEDWGSNLVSSVYLVNNKLILSTYIHGSRWVFLYKVVFLSGDGERFEISLGNGNRNVRKDASISETYTNILHDTEVEQLRKVLNGSNPTVSYLGEKNSIEKQKISKDNIQAYLETFDKYEELKK